MLLLSLLICSQPGTNTRIAPTYSRCKYQIDMSVRQLSDYSNDDTTQAAAVLTAKDCIAAATYQINLAHARYSLCFTTGQKMPPAKKIAPSLGGSGSTRNTWFLGSTQVISQKGHIDWFSHFRAHSCELQTCTDRHTCTQQNIGNNSSHLMQCTAMWPNDNNNNNHHHPQYDNITTSTVQLLYFTVPHQYTDVMQNWQNSELPVYIT